MNVHRTLRLPLLVLIAIATLPRPAHAGTGNSWLHPGFENGVYHYAVLGEPGLNGAFTIEMWFRGGAQTLSYYPVLCQKPTGNLWNGDADYAFLFDAGHLLFRVTTTTNTYQVVGPTNLLDGQWHHVAGVRTTDAIPRILLYVDGVLAGAPVTIAGSSTLSNEVLGVGGLEFTGYAGNYFEGDIDEFRIWNVARTAAEIERDRWREIGYQTGLVVAYHFNDWYPSYLGAGPIYHSFSAARPNGVPRMGSGPGGPPIVRGEGIDGAASIQTHVTANFPTARGRRIAARANGHFVAAVEHATQDLWRIEFMSVDGSTVIYRSSESIDEPVVLTAEGNRVYLVARHLDDDPILSAYNATNPNSPTKFPTSVIQTFLPKSGTLDPFVPNRLWIAGTDFLSPFRSNRVVVYDTTTPFTVLINATLPNAAMASNLFDVAASGPYAMISFNDGMVRTYAVTYAGDGGGSLAFLSETYLGAPAHLVRLRDPQRHHFLAAYGNTVTVLNETAQAIATGSVGGGPVLGATADGTRAYLSVPEGLRAIDVYPPAYPLDEVAWYVAEDLASSDPSFDATTGRVYLASTNAGLYGISVNSVIAVENSPPVAGLALRAYPNPIHEQSAIVVHVPEESRGNVDIIDVTGRRVRHFPTADLTPGEHRLMWDGRDDRGKSLGAGIYFCQARFGQDAQTVRLVLLK